ncbi:hypothetical protein KGF57_003876 [Candida theae]|uniref:AB hydrolase-1 domain-containing protein n=1 Tax=Candida theae TaxID=1198502 RepID=A0AAD5BCF9_9ASCO|nr:uncharacterized protein KGF57_003876 [Candida theae]KAI5954851.1 hypothetical protein KGF57_003876 [Candida theae]
MSFTLQKKQVKAHPIRAKGSTLLAEDAQNLTIVYNKYKSNCPRPDAKSQLTYNLVFCHGTGFNKSVWNYHIKKLFQLSQSMQVPWFLDTVVSVDAVNHGDSSLANADKLGAVYVWDDGARDVIEVVQHEIRTTGDLKNDRDVRTVVVGHSMGGYIATYAAYLESTLFDSIIAIEPVIYGTKSSSALYTKLFQKIGGLIMDTFDTEQDAQDFFGKLSFTKSHHPEVLKDYIADEVYRTKNEEGKEVYKIKCTKNFQVATYMGALMSLSKGMLALPDLKVPFLHITGAKAKWNPPQSVPWVRGAINPSYLAGTVDIPNGEHLVNGEMPDTIVDVVQDFLTKRNKILDKEKPHIPEVALKRDKAAIREQEVGRLLKGDLENVYGFDVGMDFPFDITIKKGDSKL